MIDILGLIKIYKTKEHQQTALNNITLRLPSTGMVFIIGESGSGKSTLLNLIGGLDSPSYGEINVDGNNLSKLNEKELTNYRSSYLGFIFQDYSLIKDFNVYNNVKLSLDIINDKDYPKIDDVLNKVGLLDYKNRKPNQLSGGQCQRVSIARAIVKNPKIILCDEPTGNLDSENSKQVLDILKELSKDRLIVVVSHNFEDAKHYADRIIELKDGVIISDLKNDLQNNFLIENNTLFVGNIARLSEDELNKINANIGSIKEIKPLNRLSNTEEVNEQVNEVKFESKKFKSVFKTAGGFLKRGLIGISLISLFSGLLVATQGMTQNLTSFNASEVIEQAMIQNNANVLVMKKNYKNSSGNVRTNYIARITDKDKELIANSKYKNECYELVNYSMPISLSTNRLISQSTVTESSNLKNIYVCESYGVLVTEKEYVKSLFGKFKLLAEVNSNPSYGVYITDFLADSIMHYQTGYTTYTDMLGAYTYTMHEENTSMFIAGVIDTGYKAKYGELITEYTTAISNGDLATLDKIQESKDYTDLIDKITSIYGIGYSFNPNFLNDCKNINARTFTRLDRIKVEGVVVGKKQEIKINSASAHQATESGYGAPEKTILMSTTSINNLLGTKYTTAELKLLLPIKGTITGYSAIAYATNDINNYDYRINININLKNDVPVIGPTKQYSYTLSDDLFEEIQDKTIFTYAYYFKDINHTKGIYDLLRDVPFSPISPYASAASTIGTTVEAYNTAFVLIAILLGVITLSLIVIFASSIISKNKHNIGILKALGVSDKDIAIIFISQIGVIGAITSIVSLIGGLALTGVMNKILLSIISRIMENIGITMLQILKVNPGILFINIAVVIVISILSAIIPLLMLKKIKPIQIIRNNK